MAANVSLQIKGSNTAMTLTSLASLASSATAGWQSDKVNTDSSASDYLFGVKITMANTAPANDKAVYIYLCPWYYNGSSYLAASQGTTTLPTGTAGTTTIATPNDLRMLGILAYTTQNMVLQDTFLLSNCFGKTMPDAFSLILINFSGAALHSSGIEINYKPILNVG